MIKALAITGPTASGKTAVSIEVAKALGCEIICCDSMQLYKYMDIGTAKATAEERAAVPHHMLDFLSPDESYSAKSYRDEAMLCAKEIASRGKIPLFVGGTGLYIDTLIRQDTAPVPESSPEYRENIMKNIKTEEDKIALHKRLSEVDAETASAVHYNNVRRVIRALEIYDATGKPKSLLDKLTRLPNSEIAVGHITLDFHNRENLYERVDRRVDEMFSAGLADEVSSLISQGFLGENTTAAQAIGYKEIAAALAGGLSAESAREEIKQATRNYAKRQLTWFRHEKDAYRLFADFENGEMKPAPQLISECLATAKYAYEKL